jgi:hypothetical protein
MHPLVQRISIEPGIRGGKPCIKGSPDDLFEIVGYAATPRISLEQTFAALVGGIGERRGHPLSPQAPYFVPARLE